MKYNVYTIFWGHSFFFTLFISTNLYKKKRTKTITKNTNIWTSYITEDSSWESEDKMSGNIKIKGNWQWLWTSNIYSCLLRGIICRNNSRIDVFRVIKKFPQIFVIWSSAHWLSPLALLQVWGVYLPSDWHLTVNSLWHSRAQGFLTQGYFVVVVYLFQMTWYLNAIFSALDHWRLRM